MERAHAGSGTRVLAELIWLEHMSKNYDSITANQ